MTQFCNKSSSDGEQRQSEKRGRVQSNFDFEFFFKPRAEKKQFKQTSGARMEVHVKRDNVGDDRQEVKRGEQREVE